MSPRQQCVLAALGGERDEWWPFLRTVAEESGLSHRDARNAARALARMGFARLVQVFNEADGLTAGSTYVRTAAGTVALPRAGS